MRNNPTGPVMTKTISWLSGANKAAAVICVLATSGCLGALKMATACLHFEGTTDETVLAEPTTGVAVLEDRRYEITYAPTASATGLFRFTVLYEGTYLVLVDPDTEP